MAAGAQLTQFAQGQKRIIKPGASLSRAAQVLADPKRAEGKFPFQWLYPGPNSRMALPNGAVALPAQGNSATIFQYTVPSGYRLVVTGVTLNAFTATGDWSPGSGQLLFNLIVEFSTGPRTVEFMGNLAIPLGTFERPYPLEGRLEFSPEDVIEATVENVSIAVPSAADYAYAILQGFTYPTSEGA